MMLHSAGHEAVQPEDSERPSGSKKRKRSTHDLSKGQDPEHETEMSRLSAEVTSRGRARKLTSKMEYSLQTNALQRRFVAKRNIMLQRADQYLTGHKSEVVAK